MTSRVFESINETVAFWFKNLKLVGKPLKYECLVVTNVAGALDDLARVWSGESCSDGVAVAEDVHSALQNIGIG